MGGGGKVSKVGQKYPGLSIALFELVRRKLKMKKVTLATLGLNKNEDETLSVSQLEILEGMEEKVLTLWKALEEEPHPDEQESLRQQYERAFRTYKIQKEIVFA